MPTISRNTEAVLLLTAPLILKKGDPDARLLTPGEYNRVAAGRVVIVECRERRLAGRLRRGALE